MKRLSLLVAGLCVSGLLVSCSPELFVIEGDEIALHYVGTLESGEEFDSSRKSGRSPLAFTVGDGKMIKGFDMGVRDMKIGEVKDIKVAPADAYGEKVMVQTFPRQYVGDLFPDDEKITTGSTVTTNGIEITILSLTEDEVTIQYPNPHHLAGESLNFEIELLAINPECGDGKKEHDDVEMCDDGNTDNGDGCDNNCKLEN